MKIETIEAAFAEIEKKQERVPVEAIEFLHNCETDDVIIEKLKFSLENAYDDIYFDAQDDYYYPTPLWYAIVAEEHLCEELVQPIISLFSTEFVDDWDYLNEQGGFLVGKLCDYICEKAVTPILEAIRDYCTKEGYPILYLFDCLHYINNELHLPLIFDILKNDNFTFLDAFAVELAHAQVTETLDRLKEIRQLRTEKNETKPDSWFRYFIVEIDEAIEELETGVLKYPEMSKPEFKMRPYWKDVYKDYYKEDEPVAPVEKKKKIGRNDPCICGSGVKYKKCCLPKVKAGELLPHLI